MPGLASNEGDGAVLRAEVGEKVVEAEKCKAVLWGKPVAESSGIRVGEVRPGVEGSAAEAVKRARGVAARGNAETDGFLKEGLRPAALECDGGEG